MLQEEGLQKALEVDPHIVDGKIVKANRAGPRPELEPDFHDFRLVENTAASVPLKPETVENNKPPATGQQQAAPVFGNSNGKGPRLYVGGIADELDDEDIKVRVRIVDTIAASDVLLGTLCCSTKERNPHASKARNFFTGSSSLHWR